MEGTEGVTKVCTGKNSQPVEEGARLGLVVFKGRQFISIVKS